MTPAPIQVGDTVRVLDTPYTRSHGGALQWAIGQLGTVVEVYDYSDVADVTGFSRLYDVHVRPYAPLPLIEDDLELVARPARIR